MTKREFLDTVFALVPNEANAIMDAFDEYVESSEPHWIPVTERLPETEGRYIVVNSKIGAWHVDIDFYRPYMGGWMYDQGVIAWMPLPEHYKGGEYMRYCRIKGKFCVYATEWGYCSFTVCREVTT